MSGLILSGTHFVWDCFVRDCFVQDCFVRDLFVRDSYVRDSFERDSSGTQPVQSMIFHDCLALKHCTWYGKNVKKC